jgi:hypothetical protein
LLYKQLEAREGGGRWDVPAFTAFATQPGFTQLVTAVLHGFDSSNCTQPETNALAVCVTAKKHHDAFLKKVATINDDSKVLADPLTDYNVPGVLNQNKNVW